jgi:catecholate siderophore receptor
LKVEKSKAIDQCPGPKQGSGRGHLAAALVATPLAALSLAALSLTAHAQSTPPAAPQSPGTTPAPPSVPDSPNESDKAVLPTVRARGAAEVETTGKDSLRSQTTGISKGRQALRDVPQSVSVITEKLIDDRNLDTLKDTLKNTGGVSFLAAEGGEEDIRLRGFSLQGTGDIFIDGMRDPAFYERDSFNWDRLEVLRGSASMLFGRGSTGGAVNQVSKRPMLLSQHEVTGTLGQRGYQRGTGDFNLKTGENSAMRLNLMINQADNGGVRIDKVGFAPSARWGIGTQHEFGVSALYLQSDNGIDYGLPWLTPGASGTRSTYLWTTRPGAYYGMASDTNTTGTRQVTGWHNLRFGDQGDLKTQARLGRYVRDQRASAIRFAPAAQQPDRLAVTSDTFNDRTVLTRGSNNKVMNLENALVQTDYANRHRVLGLTHEVAAGVDATIERFDNFTATLPTGTTLVKPPTTVGSSNDGARVDESRRLLTLARDFETKAAGVYAQDLVQFAPHWKVLGGLRWDKLAGEYNTYLAQGQATTGTPPVANPCFTPANTRFSRSDSLVSKRVGVLFQPSAQQSYHASYGTSFNTAGETYQYDPGTSNTPPEGSRNLEIGAKLEAFSGRLSTRMAVFHTTKTNERNRDSESVNACNYMLSGKRHAAGVEVDIAGRITPAWEVYASYTYIPTAVVDASSGAAGTEPVGSRPGLTPRHSGTFWTTYQVRQAWRVGAGLNARGADKPTGLAVTSALVAPRYITADLMVEHTRDDVSLKGMLTNLTNAHYADYLYRGHYVAGRPRTFQFTVNQRFY